jgi:predicted CXXCH cytochrome family protein
VKHRPAPRLPHRTIAVVLGLALALLQPGGIAPQSAIAADNPAASGEPSPSPAPTSIPGSPAPQPSPSDDLSSPPASDAPTAPDPTLTASASPEPSPAPAPDQTAEPQPSAVPGPSADPTSVPDSSLAPDPTDEPSMEPSVEPSVEASAEPTATAAPEPTPIAWQLSDGQQSGHTVARAVPLYRLHGSALSNDTSVAVHSGSGLNGPDCAACHAAHTAAGSDLLSTANPDPTLCYRCHSGTGSPFDVHSAISAAPANDPATDAYYRHVVSSGQAVDGRTAGCLDCHNPHDATATRPQITTSGWTASGDIRGADGEAVTNGPAGTAPTYTLISRSNGGQSLTYEYQLCLACHSGATSLPDANTNHPSWWALDKGIELNPANASYHPVEAAGRNASTQMAASLAGTSPFKAWDLSTDSTIRCTSCHGDPSTVNQTADSDPLQPAAAAYEPPHASDNRGLLTAPYRDRVLKSAGEAYDAADFALCYLCHAERPFVDPNVDPTAADTAFPAHGLHVAGLQTQVSGGGTSIDTPGAGEGLALCAECHFRIHSTAIAYKPGDTGPVARDDGSTGLVNFAPDVLGVDGNPPTWTPPGSDGVGSCTLTCHGYTHQAGDPSVAYSTAPGTSFSASPTSGSADSDGLDVQFTDATRYIDPGNASWSWDFGDGSTSTLQSPDHHYTTASVYTVTLTVTRISDGLSATLVRTGYVTVTP